MKYNLFLFDLDDTLLNFRESERVSFFTAMQSLGVTTELDALFANYQIENKKLWTSFEQGLITKDHLKTERFRKIFHPRQIEIDPEQASNRYLEALPESVVLMDYSVDLLHWLSQNGEIGIITNGLHKVQHQRIQNSALAPFIHFVCVSEDCGYAKPDIRFFEHSAKKARNFNKASALVIGDRLETDILGAHNFGVDACWFNPDKNHNSVGITPTYEIQHLSEIQKLIAKLKDN